MQYRIFANLDAAWCWAVRGWAKIFIDIHDIHGQWPPRGTAVATCKIFKWSHETSWMDKGHMSKNAIITWHPVKGSSNINLTCWLNCSKRCSETSQHNWKTDMIFFFTRHTSNTISENMNSHLLWTHTRATAQAKKEPQGTLGETFRNPSRTCSPSSHEH